jgi:glycosyltransferase involved in cell wall biosynthesis
MANATLAQAREYFAQTYRPLENIVADDGSTDGTATVAAAFGNRVKYVHQTNLGYPEAKNLGLGEARGEFIAFLDADDLWHPAKLERQMARFAEPAPIDLCLLVMNFDAGARRRAPVIRTTAVSQSAWH